MPKKKDFTLLDVGGYVLDVGDGVLVADEQTLITFDYSHSGLNVSTLHAGQMVRDAIYLLDREGRHFTKPYTIVGSELRNLASGQTYPATAVKRPGRDDVVDIQLQAPPAALEGETYELRTIVEFESTQYEHARIYNVTHPLKDMIARVKATHLLSTADRYIVEESQGFAQYLVMPGTGDYQTGTIIAAQDLFDIDGQRVDSVTDFHARVVNR